MTKRTNGSNGHNVKFILQRRNANRHTPRGLGALEKSIQSDGWIGAQTAAADGEIFDGSARLEVAADKFGNAEPIVIESDGTRPVVVVRKDIPNADDPRAKRLAIAANRIAQIDLDWNSDVLADLAAQEGDLLKGLFEDDELAQLLQQPPNFQPVGIDEQGRLDEKKKAVCPNCGHEFTP